ncbi:ABC transporter permease [Leptolyngbya sp. AN03gr2]|uniref:ABC transporter permease n=1 Tax=unclassified Leptolyngbya TaxID=2650499 RepID=UPI003D310CD9
MALSIAELLKMTWRSILTDLIRSGLTTIGVFMGVAAVSATLNVQSITNAQIDQKLSEREKPFITPSVYPTDFSLPPPKFEEADIRAIKEAIPIIRSISLVGTVGGVASVQFEDKEVQQLDVRSVSLNYLDTTGRRMLQGRFFDRADFEQYRPVVIIDEKLATTLFQGQNSLRQSIYAGGTRLTIIGVTETKTDATGVQTQGTLWLNDNFAAIAQGDARFTALQISPHTLEQIPELRQRLEQFLIQRYPQMSVYLNDNATDLLKEKETQAITARSLLVIGLIALTISGVGIANITIAAVIERTKEIGIRRAIGATQSEVMLQFVMEAVVLSVIGGVGAIAATHSLTQVATTTIVKVPYQFSIQNAALAMGSAVVVGVGSSFLPALRTAKIDIIKSLRSE